VLAGVEPEKANLQASRTVKGGQTATAASMLTRQAPITEDMSGGRWLKIDCVKVLYKADLDGLCRNY
jgi:hypothetical protein